MSDRWSGSKPAPALSRRLVWVLVAVVLVAVGILVVKYGRHYVVPKRFYVVEPGALYRSGQLQAGPLRDVLSEYSIHTILTLLSEEPDDPVQQAQKRIAAQMGVEIIRIPMPGDGCGGLDALDEAADVLADSAHYPVLVHCAGGENRTGAVYAAYRMKYRGWDIDRALKEGDRFGLSIRDNPPLIKRLRTYYRKRVDATNRTQPSAAQGDAAPVGSAPG